MKQLSCTTQTKVLPPRMHWLAASRPALPTNRSTLRYSHVTHTLHTHTQPGGRRRLSNNNGRELIQQSLHFVLTRQPASKQTADWIANGGNLKAIDMVLGTPQCGTPSVYLVVDNPWWPVLRPNLFAIRKMRGRIESSNLGN